MSGISLEDQIQIRRPRPDVFAFVSDREQLPAWTVGVKRANRTSPGPIGVGTTFCVVGKMLGRRVESTYQVTAYEPETLFSGRLVSPFFSVEETYRFDRGEGHTVVRLTAEARPERGLRLLGPLLVPAMHRQVRTDHRRLKTVLERSRRGAARTKHENPHPGHQDEAGESGGGE